MRCSVARETGLKDILVVITETNSSRCIVREVSAANYYTLGHLGFSNVFSWSLQQCSPVEFEQNGFGCNSLLCAIIVVLKLQSHIITPTKHIRDIFGLLWRYTTETSFFLSKIS